MAHKLLSLALLGALATSMVGCASKVPIRARGATGGVQGAAWELVVPGPEVALALAARPAGEHPFHPPYMTRRDHALGATTPSWAPVATTGSAPTTIERQRPVYLRRSFDSFLFFTSPGAWPAPSPWWSAPPHSYPPARYWEP
jgi:hypothetical protein